MLRNKKDVTALQSKMVCLVQSGLEQNVHAASFTKRNLLSFFFCYDCSMKKNLKENCARFIAPVYKINRKFLLPFLNTRQFNDATSVK